MKPRLILAMIAGGASGVLTFMITGAGLVATPSPGSIFAYIAVTPKGGWFGVLLGIVIAAGVTFAVASLLLGFGRKEPAEDETEAVTPEELADRPRHAAAPGKTPEPAITTGTARTGGSARPGSDPTTKPATTEV